MRILYTNPLLTSDRKDYLSVGLEKGLKELGHEIIEAKSMGEIDLDAKIDLAIVPTLHGGHPQMLDMYELIRDNFTGPLVLLDSDDSYFHCDLYSQYKDNIIYFRKEFFSNITYPNNVYPISFVYPFERKYVEYKDKNISVMFAGQTKEWGREIAYGCSDIPNSYIKDEGWDTCSHDKYMERLRRAKVGLHLKGAALDTYRFWEILSNGVLLVTEELPITIVNKPVHGEHYFEFKREHLIDGIKDLLKDDNLIQKVINNAKAFVDKWHTPKARAQYILDTVFKK